MKLKIWFNQILVGTLTNIDDELSFEYSSKWLACDQRFPLSFALPLGQKKYLDKLTRSFFENLIFEEDFKKHLAQAYQIDLKDDFSFIKEFGLDSAGALTIAESLPKKRSSIKKEIPWEDLASKVENRESLLINYAQEQDLKFSLAGAQDKLPVIYKNDKIFLGLNGYPSSHILKPKNLVLNYKETPQNEYYVMKLALVCGLNVPQVELKQYKDQYFYLTERFDRDEHKRLHQQDFCQALGLSSRQKYQSRGGPDFVRVYLLVKEYSENKAADLLQLIDWFCFNLLIGNHDTHAKNLSFLYSDHKWSLAPFYDLLSTAVYARTTKNFAFSIGEQFDPVKLKAKNFEILETELGVKNGFLRSRLARMIKKIEMSKVKSEFFITQKIDELIKKRINVFNQRVLND